MNLWGKSGRLSAHALNLHLFLLQFQSRTSLLFQTPVSALLAGHTRPAKTDIQLTESICTLAGAILAGSSSVAASPRSTHYTTHLLGLAVVRLILSQRAKTKLPKGSRQRNHWQPCHTPSASLHDDRWWQRSLLVRGPPAVCSNQSRITRTEVVSPALEV